MRTPDLHLFRGNRPSPGTAIVAVAIVLVLLVPVPSRAVSGDSAGEQAITSDLLAKAREAADQSEYRMAETYYQEVLRRNPAHVAAMLELSHVYDRMGRLEYARGLLVRASQNDPDDPSIVQRLRETEDRLGAVLAGESNQLIAAGQYEQAIPKIVLNLSFDPENPNLYFDKSRCLLALGRVDAAAADIEKAIRISPADEYLKLQKAIDEATTAREQRKRQAQNADVVETSEPAKNRKALAMLSEVIRRDPRETWARDVYAALTGRDSTATTALTDSVGLTERAASFAAGVTRWSRGVVEKHLGSILVLIAILLVFRSPLSRSLLRFFKPQPLLHGQLTQFRLPEILLMLDGEPHTGVLHVRGRGCSGRIYFDNGEPVDCVVGKIVGRDALVHLLNNSESGSFHFKRANLPATRTIETPLSVILLERSHETDPGKSTEDSKKSKMKELLDSSV